MGSKMSAVIHQTIDGLADITQEGEIMVPELCPTGGKTYASLDDA